MTHDEAPADRATPHLQRVLGLPSLIFFGLAYMVPLTVFTTFGVVAEVTDGHLAAAYLVTLAAMLFTAYSYGHMVRAYPNAGSAYTYARGAFGGHVGFMVGWALLLDYVFLPMINYLVIGIYMAEYFPAVDKSAWILLTIGLVTGLNILGIRMVARMNFIIIVAQLVFIVVFLAFALRLTGGADAPSLFSAFYTPGMEAPAIMAGAAILCLSFLGFDAVSTLSEEAHEPTRQIPRAILLCTLLAGALFVIVSAGGHLVFPDWREFGDVESAATDVMQRAGGRFLVSFFTAAYVSGAFASAMASQASVSRILYAMGRDQVLPRPLFGRISARYATPVNAILIVSAFSLLALVISLSLAATMISFGALVAFSFVNLAVVKHYGVDRKRRSGLDLLRFLVMPTVGFLLTIWLWTSLSANTFAVGLSWVAVGFVYLLYLTRLFRRDVPALDVAES